MANGQMLFHLGGSEGRVGRGDFVLALAGTVHGFSGLSQEPARVIILDVPATAHAAGIFIEIDQKVKSLSADIVKVPGIGFKHGVRFCRLQIEFSKSKSRSRLASLASMPSYFERHLKNDTSLKPCLCPISLLVVPALARRTKQMICSWLDLLALMSIIRLVDALPKV